MLLSLLLAPAETTNYMYLGFAFIFGPMFLYIWSLISRRKNLKKELVVLKELED